MRRSSRRSRLCAATPTGTASATTPPTTPWCWTGSCRQTCVPRRSSSSRTAPAGWSASVRAVRAGRTTRGDPPPRGVYHRRGPLAQPGQRSARRLRRPPRWALRTARSTDGPDRVHHRVAGRADRGLRDLNAALAADDAGGVSIGTRAGRPWITVPKLAKQPEPANLERIKAAVQARWGTVDLLDFLAEADHHVGLIDCFPSIATRETMPTDTLRARLLLVLFALGTNTGIKHVADGDHGHSEAALRHVRRLFVTKENLRRAIATLVNANYAARAPQVGVAGTACASDSKKFGSWESNLMTEWHARYRGPGVMIYWHVEKGRLCVYSQLKSCSSSEVAAMMEEEQDLSWL